MANKKKPENGEDLIRQYLKDKAAGRSTFDEKSDFQKRVRSGENFGKPHDFGQSEKQKPSVPKKPDTVTKSSVSNKKMPITDNKRRDLQITQSELEKEQKPAVSEKPKSKPENKEDEARNALFAEKALAEKSRENIKKANSSALDKARNTKKSGNAQDFVNSRSEAMGKAAIRDGEWIENLKNRNIQDELKAEKERLKYQWEEAGRRYDKLSDEEKNALYKKRNSSALERARMQEVPGGSTAQEYRTNQGEYIAQRYNDLEKELSDPTKGGEYAFLNRLRSAAGESVENLGYWLYDTFGYEPGKKVYDEGTARKIGDIADVQLQNEIAARPSQLGQDIAKAGDSIATMLSYKLLTGPISTFAGSIASEAAFGKGLAAGVNNGLSLDKAAKEVAKVAAEKGSHVANNIFTGGMAMGSFGDKYIESRNAGLDKVESSARALVAGVTSYVAGSLGGIGGGKSPLNAIEEEAKKKWVTAILYEALEEGGEEFAEYTMNYLADGVIDLVARGKWEQNWDWNELLESAKIASITGGLFGVSNQLMTKAFSGNAKIDEKLQDAKKEVLEDMKVTFEAEKDPAVRAAVNAQLDNIIPDSEIAAAIENNNAQNGAQIPVESTLPLVENVQTETQKAKDTATEQRTEKQTKQEEMLDQLDVLASERKAQEKAAAGAQQNTESAAVAQQKNTQGTARKADSKTINKAYKNYADGNTSAIKKTRFENLYNEAYNAESFEAFKEKHNKMGQKLSDIMQKAYENGHRAEIKAENSALFNDGLIMDEGDRYMLKSRKDIDSLIERYKKAAEDGVVPIETDSENYYDQFRELSAEESQKYSEAAAKLEKYRDEHFAADKKSVSTEKKPANTEEKTASTESSTDKKKKRIESVIRNLEMLKQKLENGDMAKLEQKNPDKYNDIMFKFEQQTADKNGSDYLGSAEDVSVLIDKYKTDLEMLEAENGAQSENVGAQTENAAKTQQISENAAKTQQNEYSPEYQNGAEHPETVGAMESDPMNITRAANESKVQPEKASTKNPFNDYDRYQSETKLTKADRNALERVVKNPVKGERTVWQETVDSVIDGDTYFEKDGNYYVKNQEGKTHRVAQSVFLFAEYLGKKGVRYTLNQTAEVPKEIGGRSVSKSVATALASRIGTNEFVEKIAANMEARDNRNAGLTYFKKKHSEVINWAKNYIEANGAEKAYAEFERAADGKTKYDAEHNVLGLMMCEMLSDINTSEANDLGTRIYAMIAANQTNAGQVSESMKMLKTLDRTNFTAFYEQLTQTLNQKHEKQLDGKKIILDDKLLKKAKESVGTENEARATLDLNRDIANQIPASGWDKINAVRYFCMLSSPITAIKNFFSNAVQLAMVKQKNVWLYLFERGFKKKHGDYVLTTSLTKDKEVSKYAGNVFNSAKNSETKYKEGSFAEINRTNTMRSLPGKLNKF